MGIEIYLQTFRAINQMQSPERGLYYSKSFCDSDT